MHTMTCFFTLIVVSSLFFSRLDSVGELLSAHETHNVTSTHYSHNSAPSTIRSDGFLWTTTSSCCCNARSSSAATIHAAATLSSEHSANTCSDIWAAASHATAAAALISGSTHMKRRCNFRSEDVPCLGLFHKVAQAVPSAGRTRARTSCCLRRRDGGVSSVHPQRYQGFDPTFA